MNNSKNNLTPLMRQYYEVKNKYPETILLFQVGDFYEIFFDDAIKASNFLGIALTQRGTDANGNPIPLCGVPTHVVDHYLTKLIKGGFKVAVCEQLESPKPGKIIERGVTQVLTPGTLTDIKLLDEKSASYLCIFFPTAQISTLIFAELLTGQLFVTSINSKNNKLNNKLIESELSRFMPDEIVVPDIKLSKAFSLNFQQLGFNITLESFDLHENNLLESAQNWFTSQFNNIDNINNNSEAFKLALGLFYKYLNRNNQRALTQLKQLFIYQPEDFLMLDCATQRNLELVKNFKDSASNSNCTLFSILDKAVSPMGSRTIKKWILRPLIKKDLIEQRLNCIQTLIENINLKEQLRKYIQKVGDLERIIGRIALRRTQLYDYVYLMRSLELVPLIKKELANQQDKLLNIIESKILDFSELQDLLIRSINDDSANQRLIKSGFNSEVDRLRYLVEQGTQEIIKLERKEQESTGISSLKIKYNGSYGYSIEVTKANLDAVPNYYMRIQTLTNRERFTTQELKDLEYDLSRANSDIAEVEKEVFESIKNKVELYLNNLKKLSFALSYLDALSALAEVAYINNYTRPTFNDQKEIIIKDGRHAVIENNLKNKFIPNSTVLNSEQTLWIITGPNMGGKSTYLRQVALICIMAQMGSFVPATNASLFIIDRIFTRIGAADNLAEGKSTFLVEMEETALICNQATENSLVILDEVGRGTSTYDGLAIAQAVVEYIYQQVKSRCLFATHYHELTALSQNFPGIMQYYAASTKSDDKIVLLHKILPGVAQGSFGLEVAKLAQLPSCLINRAEQILNNLTENKTTYKNIEI